VVIHDYSGTFELAHICLSHAESLTCVGHITLLSVLSDTNSVGFYDVTAVQYLEQFSSYANPFA
jgi:hypothetical protein